MNALKIALIVGFGTFSLQLCLGQGIVHMVDNSPKPKAEENRKNVAQTASPTEPDCYVGNYGVIDLGLSVVWAYTNVGASTPFGFGDYYAWGEIEPKNLYSQETSSLMGASVYGISGNPEYDVATCRYGEVWCMPTDEQFKELVDKCTWRWCVLNSIKGYQVTGPNGNAIFLPACGLYRSDDGAKDSRLIENNKEGCYWSSIGNDNYGFGGSASALKFDNTEARVDSYNKRFFGCAVRPVIGKTLLQDYNKAKSGNLDSQYRIGEFFYEHSNQKQAMVWLTKSAESGNLDSAIKIGKIYAQSQTLDSLQMADKWFTVAYDGGRADIRKDRAIVYNKLGILCDKNKNLKEAMGWFEKGAELGLAEAQNNCGIYYCTGKGVASDQKLAFDYFRLSANQGYMHAENNLGTSYYLGRGVSKDYDEAEKWFSKAAEKGHVGAKEMLKRLKKTSITVYFSDNGEPCIGCVLIHGRNGKRVNAVVSDIDGKVYIRDIRKDDVLTFSYVGYKTKDVVILSEPTTDAINFSLTPGKNKETEYYTPEAH